MVVVLGAAVVGGDVEVVAATDVVVDSEVVLVELEVVVEASHAKLTRARETMRAHLDAGMFPTYRHPRDYQELPQPDWRSALSRISTVRLLESPASVGRIGHMRKALSRSRPPSWNGLVSMGGRHDPPSNRPLGEYSV